MKQTSRPSEQQWRSAKDRLPVGATVRGTVSAVVPFGLFVDLPGTTVQGVVLAPGFADPAAFARRAESHPVGSSIELIVLGPAEGRLQIDLRLPPADGSTCGG